MGWIDSGDAHTKGLRQDLDIYRTISHCLVNFTLSFS